MRTPSLRQEIFASTAMLASFLYLTARYVPVAIAEFGNAKYFNNCEEAVESGSASLIREACASEEEWYKQSAFYLQTGPRLLQDAATSTALTAALLLLFLMFAFINTKKTPPVALLFGFSMALFLTLTEWGLYGTYKDTYMNVKMMTTAAGHSQAVGSFYAAGAVLAGGVAIGSVTNGFYHGYRGYQNRRGWIGERQALISEVPEAVVSAARPGA